MISAPARTPTVADPVRCYSSVICQRPVHYHHFIASSLHRIYCCTYHPRPSDEPNPVLDFLAAT